MLLFIASKPRISQMRAREAKDFLVRQTTEQASLEGVPLSDLEKRMMYFTEGTGALEDPAALNDEFEAQYNTAEFEKKISRLMRLAHKRLKKEDQEKSLQWAAAIRTLRKGDHYILVLAGDAGAGNLFANWRITLAVLLPVGLIFFCIYVLPRFLPAPNPFTLRIGQALFLALLIAAIFFPRVFTPAGKLFGRCFDWIIGVDKDKDVET
jgi:hypothetical protein